LSAEESCLKKPSEETTTTNPIAAPASAAYVVGSLSSSFVASQGSPEATDSTEVSAAIARAQAVFGVGDAQRVAGCVRAVVREHPVAWVAEAVELAARKGKGWGFVVVVLKNWKHQGCPSPRTTVSKPARTQEGTNSADDRKSVPGADAVNDMVAHTLTRWRAGDGDNDALNDYYRLKMSCAAEGHILRHGTLWDADERASFRRSVREAVEVMLEENRLVRQPAAAS
jgi:hypothetical protein